MKGRPSEPCPRSSVSRISSFDRTSTQSPAASVVEATRALGIRGPHPTVTWSRRRRRRRRRARFGHGSATISRARWIPSRTWPADVVRTRATRGRRSPRRPRSGAARGHVPEEQADREDARPRRAGSVRGSRPSSGRALPWVAGRWRRPSSGLRCATVAMAAPMAPLSNTLVVSGIRPRLTTGLKTAARHPTTSHCFWRSRAMSAMPRIMSIATKGMCSARMRSSGTAFWKSGG